MKNEEVRRRSRSLRTRQTDPEGLLWSLVRANQLCGLKFRRQHPIGPYFADFVCLEFKLVIELDGGYHDYTAQQDLDRQRFLESAGWSVMRFSNEEVLNDVEAVLVAIAQTLDLPFDFQKRKGRVSGSQKEFRGG